MLSVLIQDDAAAGLYESPTFCKLNDNKRPNQVGTPDGSLHQVCPADLTMGVDEVADATPGAWYVRVMFDELLDPNIEELVPIVDASGMETGTYSGTIKNTKPVKLECQSVNGGTMVEIPYDGYYSPSGNNVTWPLGPSLVIKANSPELVATQSECQVTINANVVDKDGNPVPDAQKGPYKFKIAPIAPIIADTAPADGDMVDPLDAGVDVTFNTPVDPATVAFAFDPDPGNGYAAQETDTEFFFGADFPANGMFTWSIPQGTMMTDTCGKVTTFGAPSTDAGTQLSFTTNDLAFNGISPFDGQMNVKPTNMVHLKFNQYMNPFTLATTEWSLSPAVAGATIAASGGDVVIVGEFAPSTMYTFTLKSGATIDDCPGGEVGASSCTSTSSATFTNSMGDQVVHFTTAALALTSTTPKDNDTVTLDASGIVTVDLAFNFDADAATLLPAEFTSSSGVTFAVDAGNSGGNVIELASTAPVPPGDYTFTLKQGATINDSEATPATYTQAADLVIHFTVEAAPAPTATPACY